MNFCDLIDEVSKFCCNVCEFGSGFDGCCDLGNDFRSCSICRETSVAIVNFLYRRGIL